MISGHEWALLDDPHPSEERTLPHARAGWIWVCGKCGGMAWQNLKPSRDLELLRGSDMMTCEEVIVVRVMRS